jgi:hypothetical protein
MLNIHYAKLRGGTIRSAQLRGKLSAVLLNAQKRALKELEEYVATWNNKPFFETKGGTRYAGGDLQVGISTDDPVFWWLEEGTRVRYAHMTDPFEAKTKRGRISSQKGVGGYAYLNVKDPRPGIEPRQIGLTIERDLLPKFIADVKTVTADIDFIGEGLLG